MRLKTKAKMLIELFENQEANCFYMKLAAANSNEDNTESGLLNS